MKAGQVSPRVLALWSAPRCRSTAFLRMMVERRDFVVLHEPFSHVADFGEARVGPRVVHSEPDLMRALLDLGRRAPVFFKDTTDFRYPALLADEGFLAAARHTFLVRDPSAAIASHHAVNPEVGRDEIGFAWLHEIYEAVRGATGEKPVVLDADDLVARPAAALREYCGRVGIAFRPEALSWEPGLREEWRRTARWHREVGATSGFEAVGGRHDVDVEAHPVLGDFYRYHLPFYERLHAERLRV